MQGRRQFAAAVARLNSALWLRPDWPNALSELAWLLATSPRGDIRDGLRAVDLAERALKLGDAQAPSLWAALDAAYAESGRFSDALRAAEKTRELALAASQTEVAEAAERRLALYRAQKPYRQ
jgi:hypothetical protein